MRVHAQEAFYNGHKSHLYCGGFHIEQKFVENAALEYYTRESFDWQLCTKISIEQLNGFRYFGQTFKKKKHS